MKKMISFLMVVAFLFAACNDQPKVKGMNDSKNSSVGNGTSSEAKEEHNKQTSMTSLENFNKHDINTALKDVTPGFMDYGDGSMKPLSLDSLKSMVSEWFQAFPDYRGENLTAVSDGQWVMIWGEWSGTWKNDFMGQKATGKSFKLKDVDIFRFNDEGKITEHHNILPISAISQQVGLKMQ